MMVRITVAATLKVQGLPEDLEGKFIKENLFPNPLYDQLAGMGKWTGKTPANIKTFSRAGDDLILPRGYFQAVEITLKRAGLQPEVVDRTVCPPANIPEPTGQLYPYQVRALDALLKRYTGILIAPPGAGKTNVLLTAAHKLQVNTLIITHTSELLRQTAEQCKSWLGIEAGIIRGAKLDLQPITVAMIQTLERRDLQITGIADFFGCAMVDECHHIPATTWARVLQQLPAKYKYGFTATAWRKDGLTVLMNRLIGEKAATVTKEEVEAAGRIVVPDIEVIETAYYYAVCNGSDWNPMIGHLAQDLERNLLIVREVRSRLDRDVHALILVDRIAHANILYGMMPDLDPVLLTGELTKGERANAMGAIRAGADLTIATSHLLGEGIDVPGWDLLFLASPFSGGPRTLQAVGRVSRVAPGKQKARVVDFRDPQVPMLEAAFQNRQRIYAL